MPFDVDDLLTRAQELEQALIQRELHVRQQPDIPKFHQSQSSPQIRNFWDCQSECETTFFESDNTAAELSYESPAQRHWENNLSTAKPTTSSGIEAKPSQQQDIINPADHLEPEAKKEEKEPAATDQSHIYDPFEQAHPPIIDSSPDYPPPRSHSLIDTAPPPPYSSLIRQSPSSPQLYQPQPQPEPQPRIRKHAKTPSKKIRAKDYEQTLRWLAGRRALGRKVKG